MFDQLSNRLQKSLAKAKAKTMLTEGDVLEVMHDIKMALLEADVNFLVVKKFVNDVKAKIIGTHLVGKLGVAEQVTKIVHAELVRVLGETRTELAFHQAPTIIMLVGLQGSGKTTSVAKVARFLMKKHGFTKPLLVAADTYRPAAVEQLVTLGKELGLSTHSLALASPETIVESALARAKSEAFDLVIIDTAGRLAIDDKLMHELKVLKALARPTLRWFVTDALAGQDIVNVATKFHEVMDLTGIIITKLDSSARGGAALSLVQLLALPIVFVGTGERVSALEPFYPDRMADRILGMGDVLSLAERAEEVFDEKSSRRMMNRMLTGKFDLDDLVDQLRQMRKLGKMSKVFKMLPGMAGKIDESTIDSAEQKLVLYEVLISSMTKAERKNPRLLKDARRKQRILKGSGRTAQEYNRLINDFERMKKQMVDVMKNFGGGAF